MNIPPAPPTSPPDAPHPAAMLAEKLETILMSIVAVIAAHFRILGAFTNPLWTRYSRARVRLATLLAKLAAGTWRAPRPQPPRPNRKPSPPTSARVPYSPRYHLWLIRKIGYRAAGHGSQLNDVRWLRQRKLASGVTRAEDNTRCPASSPLRSTPTLRMTNELCSTIDP